MDESLDNQDSIEEVVTPESAVLEEMGLTDENPIAEPEKVETTEPEKAKDEPLKPEPEAEKKAITEKDLEPLNSKNQATNERFQKLTEGYKQATKTIEELTEKNKAAEETFNALNALGFNDEAAVNDLIALSEYRKVLASGDVDTFKQSIANQIKNFEKLHGKRVQIQASALDDFPDLKSRVDAFEIDEDSAIEIARARALDYRQRQSFEDQQRFSLQKSQQEQLIQASISEVEEQQKAWSKSDPDYNAILPYLQPHIEEIGSKYPPEQWAGLIRMQYNVIKQAVANAANSNKPSVQPLRSNSMGVAKPAPRSPEDAVLQAMGIVID